MFVLDPTTLYVGLGHFYIMCIQYTVASIEFSCLVTASCKGFLQFFTLFSSQKNLNILGNFATLLFSLLFALQVIYEKYSFSTFLHYGYLFSAAVP